jgi:acyl carrier protein
LEPIFRDILDNSRLNLTRESNASNVAGWDSLAHINLISAIEQQFGISFTLGELQGLKNVGEMIDLMERKLAM